VSVTRHRKGFGRVGDVEGGGDCGGGGGGGGDTTVFVTGGIALPIQQKKVVIQKTMLPLSYEHSLNHHSF
tara:strand:+ start:259 stop:468 length:210 start_codon:yes stop_codon:yes gene_type:complete